MAAAEIGNFLTGCEKLPERQFYVNSSVQAKLLEKKRRFYISKISFDQQTILIVYIDTLSAIAGRFFDKIPILEPMESSHERELYPSPSLDESSIVSEFETVRSISLSMREIILHIKATPQKGEFLMMI